MAGVDFSRGSRGRYTRPVYAGGGRLAATARFTINHILARRVSQPFSRAGVSA
jgi:hypothetical protein